MVKENKKNKEKVTETTTTNMYYINENRYPICWGQRSKIMSTRKLCNNDVYPGAGGSINMASDRTPYPILPDDNKLNFF